jgi:hypothetical protein
MLVGSLDSVNGTTWQESVMPDNGGAIIRHSEMLASIKGLIPSPQAIFVDQPPNSTIPRHYHNNAQFQVFIAGSATLGGHKVRPVAVHYATRQTVYGPIVAGADGLVYLTLRPVSEQGAHWWPTERPDVRRFIRRMQITEQGAETLTELAELTTAQIEIVIAPAVNGLGSWIVRTPPGGATLLPTHPGGAGSFLLITGGTMSIAGNDHQRHAVIWVGPNESPGAITAGAQGLELIVTQFPREALD